MTSKDKLIEFLKSTNIYYTEVESSGKDEVEFSRNIFCFHKSGDFSHKFTY